MSMRGSALVSLLFLACWLCPGGLRQTADAADRDVTGQAADCGRHGRPCASRDPRRTYGAESDARYYERPAPYVDFGPLRPYPRFYQYQGYHDYYGYYPYPDWRPADYYRFYEFYRHPPVYR
jgi:hypothetical protein